MHRPGVAVRLNAHKKRCRRTYRHVRRGRTDPPLFSHLPGPIVLLVPCGAVRERVGAWRFRRFMSSHSTGGIPMCPALRAPYGRGNEVNFPPCHWNGAGPGLFRLSALGARHDVAIDVWLPQDECKA